MSGPTTVVLCPHAAYSHAAAFAPAVLTLLLAAQTIRAARAMAQARHEAAALEQSLQAERREQGQRQTQARQQGMAALQAQAAEAEKVLDQLDEVSRRLGGGAALQEARPPRPQTETYQAWADYLHHLQQLAQHVRQVLQTVVAMGPPGGGGTDDDAQAADRFALPDWAIQALADAQAQAAADAAARAAPPSARLLKRVAHLGPVPAAMAAVAAELDATQDGMRAELLTTELRRQVQLHAQNEWQAQVLAAQALVLEQSLQDLGYQVEGIESTLFVEGGVAHFRKAHWGDYMVRMRVASGGQTLNFNVVRAVDDVASAEASVQDHLAEDRWCAEFPALTQALAARGMSMQVTRRLEAGELPVQRVARQQLPVFADESARRAIAMNERPWSD